MGILFHGFLSILTGRLSDRYGPRILTTIAGLSLGTAFFLMSQISSLWQVYLVWGLFVGVALSCSVIPIISVIPRWFINNRGTAIAIPGTGFALGAIVTPLFVQWLISSYDWQTAFLVMGFIPVIITPTIAQFLKKGPGEIGIRLEKEDEAITENHLEGTTRREFSLTQAIRTGRFWVFGLLRFGVGFCLQMIIVHIAPRAIDIGITEIAAAGTLSIIAGSSVIGRLSAGFLADRLSARQVLSSYLILMTLVLVFLLFARQIWMLSIFAMVFGLAQGGIITLLAIVVSELFGVKFMGSILGAIMLFGTIGGAVGAPLSGAIFDITRSYDISFIIGIIIAALATILSLLLLRSQRDSG